MQSTPDVLKSVYILPFTVYIILVALILVQTKFSQWMHTYIQIKCKRRKKHS